MKFKKQEFLRIVKKLNNYGRGVSGFETYYGIFEYSNVVVDNWGNTKLKAQLINRFKAYTSKEEAQMVCDRENEENFKRGVLFNDEDLKRYNAIFNR